MTDFDRNHARAVAACALYLLGALDPPTEAAFERHLGGCRACQRECERLGPVVSGLAHLDGGEAAPPGDRAGDRGD